MTARSPICSAPFQRVSDVARHAAREVDDLNADLVSDRAQVPIPEGIHLLRQPGQGVLPARLHHIDRAAVVRAQRVGKAEDLHPGQAVLDRALDDFGRALERLLLGNARGLQQFVDQRLLGTAKHIKRHMFELDAEVADRIGARFRIDYSAVEDDKIVGRLRPREYRNQQTAKN